MWLIVTMSFSEISSVLDSSEWFLLWKGSLLVFPFHHQYCVLFTTFIIISLNLVCYNYLWIPVLEFLFGRYIIYSINLLHKCLCFKLNFLMTTNLIHLFVRVLTLNWNCKLNQCRLDSYLKNNETRPAEKTCKHNESILDADILFICCTSRFLMTIFICPWKIQRRSFKQSHKHGSPKTMVPNTFSWPHSRLIFTFSRLQKHSQIFEAPHIQYIIYACKNLNETKENYPKIQAIENVNAGTALPIALEKVAVVYFIPVKSKFWPGLLQDRVGENESFKCDPTEPKKNLKKRVKCFIYLFWSLKAKA